MAGNWVDTEFEAIFREHFESMVRISRRVLRSDAEAEEVCSDTFLKLYRNGPGVFGGVLAGGAVGAWLYRVATRASIDRLRQSKRHGIQEELDEATGSDGDRSLEDPLNRLMRNERIALVRLALAQLKPEKAQLLLLRHSGLSYQEVAAAMEIKPASVGTLLARAEAEFFDHYQRLQSRKRRGPYPETADNDVPLGTPANHPSDADLSLRTPAKEQ
jgi:RNA polymerase sigma-70 factor (ECF subfamily)